MTPQPEASVAENKEKMMARKLNDGDKHLLRLIVQGHDEKGWAPVSKLVFPLVKALPGELVVLETVGDSGAGRVCLTANGQSLIDAMAWL